MAFLDWLPVIGDVVQGVFGMSAADQQARSISDTNDMQRQIARDNIAMQKEFAQQGIKWKVEDAKNAGIHPLFGLGAQTHSFSPVSVGSTPDFGSADKMNVLGKMGQNISRSIAATQNKQERELQALQLATAKADLDGKVIENQIRASQLQKLNQVGPSLPTVSDNFIPGQGQAKIVEQPLRRTYSAPGRPAQEVGWSPDVGYARTDTGLTPVPSKDVKERIEDQLVPEAMWALRNYVLPNLSLGGKPPQHMLPQGAKKWKWSYFRQEWQPDYYGDKPGHIYDAERANMNMFRLK